jgi:hypothetical protein
MAIMQLIKFERDKVFECRFRGHHFDLERNTDDDFSFGNWYMLVKTDAGETVCDGWIDDSSGYSARQAMNAACSGALLEAPKRWPSEAI